MTDLLAAFVLGIIEGITEFLPISSTGHLLIAENWLGHRSDLFNISIQAGAILAVVLIYRQRLLSLALGLRERNKRDYALKLALAFAVTGALGIVVKKLGFELPEAIAPIAWALLLGGFIMLGAEAIDARRADLPDDDPNAIGWGTAVLVGLAQVLAGVFPGTSRSAAAIFAALLFGRSSRPAATEFAFLVGIPTMFAATGYELLHTLKDGGAANEDWTALGVAFVVSALTAFAAVKWLLRYIQTHRFTVFSWYRIVLGAALLAWLNFGAASPVTAAQATQGAGSGARQAASANPAAAPTATASASAPVAVAVSVARGSAPETQREQDIRLFHEAKLCVHAAMLRPQMVGAKLDWFVSPPGTKNFSEAERQRQLQEAKAMFDLFDRADVECPPASAALTDGSIYELALRAAQAGDETAASCYVGGGFPIAPEKWRRPETQARLRENAWALIERGIQRGDWPMVMLAGLGSNPKRYGWRHVPTTALQPLGFMATSEIYKLGDRERAYRMTRLRQLGALQDGESYDAAYLEFSGQSLSDAQLRAAEAWARQTFAGAFRGRRWDYRDMEPCPF